MLEAVTTDLVSTISLKRSTQNLQLSTSCRPITPSNDVVDGAYSAASKCDRLVALKAYMNVEGDDGLMRTGWTGDRENPLMGQALLSAGE